MPSMIKFIELHQHSSGDLILSSFTRWNHQEELAGGYLGTRGAIVMPSWEFNAAGSTKTIKLRSGIRSVGLNSGLCSAELRPLLQDRHCAEQSCIAPCTSYPVT